jgi:hypothetical protein
MRDTVCIVMGMETTFTPAVSLAQATPPIGASADCPQHAGERDAPASFSLPAWADNDEARALLRRIAMERPDRSRVISDTMSGPGAFGYSGKAANQLRQLYDRFFMERIEWCAKAGHGTPLYHRRRTAVLAYDALHGPDALIASVLGVR